VIGLIDGMSCLEELVPGDWRFKSDRLSQKWFCSHCCLVKNQSLRDQSCECSRPFCAWQTMRKYRDQRACQSWIAESKFGARNSSFSIPDSFWFIRDAQIASSRTERWLRLCHDHALLLEFARAALIYNVSGQLSLPIEKRRKSFPLEIWKSIS
jgi:hypothetical protein